MLSPEDVKQIGDMLGAVEERIVARVDEKLQATEQRIVANNNQEISDLADINHEALNKLDNHEHRLVRIEEKLELDHVA